MNKLKTSLKPLQKFELSSGTYQYRILKIWEGYEAGQKDRPVIWGQLQRLKKDGTPIKSEKPFNKILEFHYGGEPKLNGEIIK
jgi:hypothetical protein